MIADFQNKATGHGSPFSKGPQKGLQQTTMVCGFGCRVHRFPCPPYSIIRVAARQSGELQAAYCLRTTGGPLIRFALRSTVTSTLSPILTKGMPLFIP